MESPKSPHSSVVKPVTRPTGYFSARAGAVDRESGAAAARKTGPKVRVSLRRGAALKAAMQTHFVYDAGNTASKTRGMRRLLAEVTGEAYRAHSIEIGRIIPRTGTPTLQMNIRPGVVRRNGARRVSSLLPGIGAFFTDRGGYKDLMLSEVRYRRLFEAARDGILLLDAASGAITDANPFMVQLLGYSQVDLLGKELWEFGLFADRDESLAAFHELQSKSYILYENLPLVTRDGDRKEVEFVSNVYLEGDHNVIQCNIRDITERKRMERALEVVLVREQRISELLQRPLTEQVQEDAFPGILVGTVYAPASDEAQVGGDFFDAFSLPDDQVALVVADTTGKGIMAAARTMQIKVVLRAFAREASPSANDVMDRLNRFACGTQDFEVRDDEMLTCITLVFLHTKTGAGHVVFAGCEPPVILRADGSVDFFDIVHACLPLGIMRGEKYASVAFQLAPADTLILLTDGIFEARAPKTRENPSLTFLGIDGTVALARQAQQASSLPQMGDQMLEGARSFAGGTLADDACILLARWCPK